MRALRDGRSLDEPETVTNTRRVVVALRIVKEEIGRRAVDFGQAEDAVSAAAEMLSYPRSSWAVPRDPWEDFVVALAVAVLRLEGLIRLGRRAALDAVREALAVLARETA